MAQTTATERRLRSNDSKTRDRGRPTRAASARTSGRAGRAERSSVNAEPRNANAEDRRFLERFGNQLSKTTHRAKWIHQPDEHEDRKGQTLATRSPDVVRAWAEARRAEPATATRGRDDGRPRTLRFDFPGYGGGRLEHIAWNDWLQVFTDRKLVFLYQEHKRDGSDSNFFRLDSPKREGE